MTANGELVDLQPSVAWEGHQTEHSGARDVEPPGLFLSEIPRSQLWKGLCTVWLFKRGVFLYSHLRSSAGVALLRATNKHARSLTSAKGQVPQQP